MNNLAQVNSLLVKTEELSSCPNCQSHDLRIWCQGSDRAHELSKQEFIYSRCQGCNLIFLSLRPLEREIYHFYPEEYDPYQPKQLPKSLSNANLSSRKLFQRHPSIEIPQKKILNLSKTMLNSIFAESLPERLQKFYEPSKTGLTLLDFGCGSEQFLNSAREKGWNPIGIDFSCKVVERIRYRGHKALLMSPKVWNQIEDESLDFVRMNHVLEHLYEPKEILQAIYAKMKPGGVLHIAVPNPYGISAQIFRSNWWGLECPRHIMLYSPSLLKEILISAKYSQIEIFNRSIVKDFLRSCGYILYDLSLISHNEIGTMTQRRRYLTALLHPFARLTSVFNVADRFDIFCKK
jgi:SAM-dependent methyltransferase